MTEKVTLQEMTEALGGRGCEETFYDFCSQKANKKFLKELRFWINKYYDD